VFTDILVRGSSVPLPNIGDIDMVQQLTPETKPEIIKLDTQLL